MARWTGLLFARKLNRLGKQNQDLWQVDERRAALGEVALGGMRRDQSEAGGSELRRKERNEKEDRYVFSLNWRTTKYTDLMPETKCETFVAFRRD